MVSTLPSALHRRLLELYAPPSVVVGPDDEILHVSEQAGRYLRLAGGQPTHGLLALVLPALAFELRDALFRARESGKCVDSRPVMLEIAGRACSVTLSVRPASPSEAGGSVALVVFRESPAPSGESEGDSGTDGAMRALEDELQGTRAHLRATIAQSEASTRDLSHSNADLHSITDDLASANAGLQAELVVADHQLRHLIECLELAALFVDRDLRIVRATPRASELLDIAPADIGKPLSEVGNRLAGAELDADVREALRTRRTIDRELHIGLGRRYVARIAHWQASDDRFAGGMVLFTDVTDRGEQQERLELMRLVGESTRDFAIITLDTDGNVTSWNRGAERIFGHLAVEIAGKSADEIFVPEDRAAGVPADERRRAREEGRAEDERWHLRRDGTRLCCSGVMTPLLDPRMRGYVKIARDLTERKRREHEREALLRAERLVLTEARAANQLKDEFLAVMSHELKNPLNLMQINAELLSRLPEVRDSDLGSRAAATVQRAVAAQARIIDDLLDLSRAHTGKLTLQLDAVDLRAIVETVGAQLRSRVALEHRVDVSVPDAPLTVRGDAMRIEQVLWNLLSNALKFTPPGGRIVLRLSCEDKQARLDVEDDGRGIEAGFLPRMFMLFQQADRQATTRAQGGLGIGLALVRELVELHGGHVEASSPGPGKGATFSVFLPTSDRAAIGRTASTVGERLRGLRVLIVDDAPDTIEAFRTLLELEGADVLSATDGNTALALLDGRPLDLVCSDIAMPGMDGYALVRALRGQPAYAKLPAIALTGFGRVADEDRALEAGFDAHLVKPFRLDQLLAVLARLGVRKGEDA